MVEEMKSSRGISKRWISLGIVGKNVEIRRGPPSKRH